MKIATGLEITGSSLSFIGSLIDTIGEDKVKEKISETIAKIKAPKLPKE